MMTTAKKIMTMLDQPKKGTKLRRSNRTWRPRETSLMGFEKLPKKGMRRQCHLRPRQTLKEIRENIQKFILPQLNTIYALTNPSTLPPEKKNSPRLNKWTKTKFDNEQQAKLKAIRVLCEKNNNILEQFWKIPQPEPQHA